VTIVRRALEEPLRQIVANAGQEPSVVVNKVKDGKDDFGFNAGTDKYENLLRAGVIDSTKVVRIALQNAASVAGMMLTMEAAIADKPEKKQPAGGGHHGHSHGDDFDDEY
jgi:chaperonin GroEL